MPPPSPLSIGEPEEQNQRIISNEAISRQEGLRQPNNSTWRTIYEEYAEQEIPFIYTNTGTNLTGVFYSELANHQSGYGRRRDYSTDEHYQNRQERRAEQDASDRERHNNRERNEAKRRLNEMNAALPEKNKFDYLCDWCLSGIRSKDNFYTKVGEETMCGKCMDNYFTNCDLCNESYLYTEYENVNSNICKKCIANPENNLVTCNECKELLRESLSMHDHDEYYCGYCWQLVRNVANRNRSDDINYRNYSKVINSKFCSEKQGSIIRSSRIFSTEIECVNPSIKTINQTIFNLPRHLGVAYDGTIKGDGKGVEFQTQRLQGKNGEDFLKELLGTLNGKGFTTNKTCGLHVHLDGGHQFIPKVASRHNTTNVRNLFLFYLMFEDVLASFLPRSRRDNKFCKKLSEEYHFNEIYYAQQLDDIEKIWYRVPTRRFTYNAKHEEKHHSRYAGINFHTLLSDNHLEIRFHSGTLNSKKILEWVNLHCQIMDRIGEGSIRAEEIKSCSKITNLDEKTEAFFSLLKLPASARHYFFNRQLKFTERVGHEEEAVVINNQ